MRLRYKAVTRDGKILQGLIDANDIGEAASYLRSKDFIPVRIQEESNNSFLKLIPFYNKIKHSDIILFTRQLASMLSSGITLIRSLEILREQMENEAMTAVVGSTITDIEEGKPLSFAIAKYPEAFSAIYVAVIKSSEASGLLDKALLRLADNLEKEEKLKATIRAALTYPAIVVILMVIVVFIMMIYVIPQLSTLYKSLNVPLPLPTQIVIGISRFVTVLWPVILGFGVLLLFLYRRWHKTEAGQLVIDNLLLKLPIFGNLFKKVILTEFSRSLSLLIANGILVVESLLQSADTTGNIHYKNAILDVAKKVENGVKIGDAITTYSLFPPVFVQLVKVGEEAGKLDETLMKASEYFERETDQLVKTLTTALEPFIMVVLGIGVAFLMISIITPIYSLISSIR